MKARVLTASLVTTHPLVPSGQTQAPCPAPNPGVGRPAAAPPLPLILNTAGMSVFFARSTSWAHLSFSLKCSRFLSHLQTLHQAEPRAGAEGGSGRGPGRVGAWAPRVTWPRLCSP